jgi:hypothetical protein
MNGEGNYSLTSARIVSILFHPLFMPVYGLAIILSDFSPLGYLPFTVKRLLLLIMVINNIFLPLSTLPFLKQMNFIRSFTLIEREERAVPMIIATLLYATTSYIVYRFPVPHVLKSFFFTTFVLSLIITVINFRWKISLHSTGAGALTGVILYMAFTLHAPMLWFLVTSLFSAGVILSARLRLNLHSPAQVWGGFFTGLAGLLLLMSVFKEFA